LLAVIDSTELVQQDQQSTATFLNAQMNYQRTRQLLDQNLVAKEDLDNAEASMRVADANRVLAKTRLGYARITAPFAGIVTKRFLDVGALVSPNSSTLFMLMDMSRVKVIVNVLEKDTPMIPKVKKAVVAVDALPGREFNGIISRYSQAIDLATRTMAVEIDIPNPNHLLKPGMFGTVTLIIEEHPDALTVPTQALLKDKEGVFVYVAEDGTARRHAVTAGVEQDSRTEIQTGLAGPENVITTGQQFVRDGGAVIIQ
jgi:membrane fusion protein (multidrug efflux system)